MPVAVGYQDARDHVVASVDQFRAEPVLISFMADGAKDPARPAREIEAILQVSSSEVMSPSGGVERDWNSRVSAQKSSLHVDWVRYPDLLVRKGDQVRAIARPGRPWFDVLAVDDRGAPRLVVLLGEG